MNLDYNKMLFKMFWEQNAEKSFDDFVTLLGSDLKYSGIKLKDLLLIRTQLGFRIEINDNSEFLCVFIWHNLKFDGFDYNREEKNDRLDILDHIKFEDKV